MDIHLGEDSVVITDDSNDHLIGTNDSTAIAIDGHIVPYYADASVYMDKNMEPSNPTDYEWYYTYGHVPVLFQGVPAEIVLWWDNMSLENYNGVAIGWRYANEDMGSQKGLFELDALVKGIELKSC